MGWKWLYPLLGVVVGFLLSELKEKFARRRRWRAHRSAILAEIEICREFAETYKRAKIAAPGHRLPTLSYQSSFHHLLGDGAFGEEETRAITLFFNQAETINRLLDQANAALGTTGDRLKDEISRLLIKCQELTDGYYPEAKKAIRSRGWLLNRLFACRAQAGGTNL